MSTDPHEHRSHPRIAPEVVPALEAVLADGSIAHW